MNIHTYHCLCSQLVLATPYTLSLLPRRQGPPGSDASLILPLGEPPGTGTGTGIGTVLTAESLSLEEDEEAKEAKAEEKKNAPNDDKHVAEDGHAAEGRAKEDSKEAEVGYSLLMNTVLERKPVVVRREDGFERRWVRRCARCRVVVGYLLGSGSEEGMKEKEGKKMEKEKTGRVVYLLEGALRGTEELRGEVGM
ncbi:MAG: hypothetical protein MMC33_003176 [Icmadophila ericetorum]|nr:hypothetical protein [Icmadophila ericetorum]